MSLDQLLQELQLEKLQLMRDAIARPSDVTRGRIEAMEKIIARIEHKKRAQLETRNLASQQIRLKLPFEVEL